MQWQLEKYAVEEFVKMLRRIFKYKNEWINEDIEIIQFNSGSSQLVFEQFFEENEKYPVITVYGMGGAYLNNGLDDYQSEASSVIAYPLGINSNTSETITSLSPMAIKLPWNKNIKNVKFEGFYINYLSDGTGVGGDDIPYTMYHSGSFGIDVIYTGSVPGTLSEKVTTQYVFFDDQIEITSSDYWISFNPPEGSNYIFYMDAECDLEYKMNHTIYSGSIVGSLIRPPLHSMGGRMESTIMVRVMTKNSTAVMRNLGEILITRFLMLKQAQYSRSSTTEQMIPTISNSSVISEWLSKGIILKGIREGSPEMRKRGINDLIFTLPISIDIQTSWSIDYPGEFLEGFDVAATPFSEIAATRY